MSIPGVAVASVDLGASSGRVLLATLSDGQLELASVARFTNAGRDVQGIFSWDLPYLVAEIEKGLGAATRVAATRGLELASVGNVTVTIAASLSYFT